MKFVGFLVFAFAILHVDGQTQGNGDPFNVHVVDTYQGIEPNDVEVRLYKKSGANQWILLKSRQTNENGRARNFIEPMDYTRGIYKFWFDSGAIYSRANVPSFLPFVEVEFEVVDLTELIHVRVIMSPYHLTTAKGITLSQPSSNATTPMPTPNPFESIVYDSAHGRPAVNMKGDLYRLENDSWRFIVSKLTTPLGGYRNLFNDSCQFTSGIYKISFDTKGYWDGLGIEAFHPTVDLILEFHDTSTALWVPLIISPYGYSFYKRGGENGVPCLNRPTTISPNNNNSRPNIQRPSGLIGGILELLGLV